MRIVRRTNNEVTGGNDMRELMGLVWWFFGPVIVVSGLFLGLLLLGPVIGVGLLCVLAYGLLAGKE